MTEYQLFESNRNVFKSWKVYKAALNTLSNQQYTSNSHIFFADLILLYEQLYINSRAQYK